MPGQPKKVKIVNLSSSLRVGNIGEDIACNCVIQKGYKILERNFKSRFGEIDIIAADNDTLVFIEVKMRSSSRFGEPEEFVTKSKLIKIRKTIDYYIRIKPSFFRKQRIEVIAVKSMVKPYHIKHIKVI